MSWDSNFIAKHQEEINGKKHAKLGILVLKKWYNWYKFSLNFFSNNKIKRVSFCIKNEQVFYCVFQTCIVKIRFITQFCIKWSEFSQSMIEKFFQGVFNFVYSESETCWVSVRIIHVYKKIGFNFLGFTDFGFRPTEYDDQKFSSIFLIHLCIWKILFFKCIYEMLFISGLKVLLLFFFF